jgi:gas vesicle protein
MSERKATQLDDLSIFWGAIIGFIVGAIVWIFHVPKRGEDTRKEIVDSSKSIIGHKSRKDNKEEDDAPTQPKQYFR